MNSNLTKKCLNRCEEPPISPLKRARNRKYNMHLIESKLPIIELACEQHIYYIYAIPYTIDTNMERIESDVLVVGTGGAGLRAAIEAEERGASVTAVSKAPAGVNNATMVIGGGFRAAVGGMTPEEHREDTIRVGFDINDRSLVEVFAKEGGERVLELKRFGVEYRVRKGGISVGESSPRGLALTLPMVEYLRKKGVRIVENVIITRLLKSDGRVVGAIGYSVEVDGPIVFSFKAVILATGGAGALYKRTDNPLRTTGDGYSLAYHAGAELRDMEFVQFFPLALAEPGYPPDLVGGPIVEEGRLINSLGEDIPEKYGITERPLVTKSRGPLSAAIMREILKGNDVNGAILLDAIEVYRRRNGEDGFLSGRTAFYKEKLQADKRPIRMSPICHFCMGGVISDTDGKTGIPGLYAAGEIVGGVHGANRHGGNALTDIIVFGARAGKAAAEYSKVSLYTNAFPEIISDTKLYSKLRSNKDGMAPIELMNSLRETMWEKAGIVRTKDSLLGALNKIKRLREGLPRLFARQPREMLVALEVSMALDVSTMIVRSALERTESRGAHFRYDYPEMNEGWLKMVVSRKAPDGTMNMSIQTLHAL